MPAGGLIEDVWYFFKVMGLSALVGHTVKLALLSNLSPPAPASRGVVVPPQVWWRQVVLSVLGLLLLGFVIGSYTMSFFVLKTALEILESHWWLLSVILANYGAALGLYIHYTFRHRPPLTSEAARQEAAASSSPQPPGPPSNWASSKAAASFRRSSIRRSSVQSLPDGAGALAAAPAAEKDTAADPDQSPAGSEGGEESEQPKPTLRERTRSAAGRLATKLRGDLWEDGNFRYSSWVLTPVWLTVLLIMFWWLQGVSRTGLVVDCLQDPARCSGGIIPFTQPVADIQMQVQDLLTEGREAAAVIRDVAVALNQTLDVLQATLGPNGTNITRLFKVVNKTDEILYNSTREVTKIHKGIVKAEEEAVWALAAAEKVGRWLGYTTAVLIALLSLYNMVRTFKRVLLFQVYMRKSGKEQDAMVDSLASRHSTSARMLARVMSTMRHSSSDHRHGVNPVGEQPLHETTTAHSLSPFEDKAASSMRLRTLSRCPTTTSTAPATNTLVTHPLHQLRGSGSSGGQRGSMGAGLPEQPAGSGASTLASLRADRENSMCVAIAQDIQRLEADMARFGIGASTALFGVMASVMWIQIRIIGLLLTFAFTLVCHPMVWKVTWERRLWIPVCTVVAIVLLNMLIVKRWIGSRLLSDGTLIKHRGAWMTYYLMFQFTYMVLGTLYATWRIILAIVSILLFAVAALDRCLMEMFTLLDGPYIAFVASVKLEGAYLAISQRDVEAEAEAARLKQLQEEEEEQEQEADVEEGISTQQDGSASSRGR